jgi:hypothetical protein
VTFAAHLGTFVAGIWTTTVVHRTSAPVAPGLPEFPPSASRSIT